MSKNRKRHPSKKGTNLGAELNQRRFPASFRIPEGNAEETVSSIIPELQELKALLQKPNSKPSSNDSSQSIHSLLKLVAEMSTGIWRTQQKMLQPGTDQPFEEMRKAYRPLVATMDTLRQAGIEIKDWTNTPYATGMIERVIAFEPSPSIAREMVVETIKPTIIYQGQLLQKGEIIVGAPEETKVLQHSTKLE